MPLDVYAAAESYAARQRTTTSGPPPIRATPRTPDEFDQQRIKLVRDRWSSQDALLLEQHRQVEENVRMLVGRQWDVWSDMLGRFVDVTQYLTDEEKRWRQRPVVNRLLYWFILTHAKLTENEPVVTFQPSTSDRKDAMLAEAMDTIFKTIYQEVGMVEALDRLVAWMIPGGCAYLKTRIDFTKGPMVDVAPAPAPDGAAPAAPASELAPADGSLQPAGGPAPDAMGALPDDAAGDVMGGMDSDAAAPAPTAPQVPSAAGPQPENLKEREGQFAVEVLGPLECRGQWGSNIPWHRKRWHIHRSYMTPDEIRQQYGVEVEPEVFETVGSAFGGGGGYLERLLFGSGYYGSASNTPGAQHAAQGGMGKAPRRDGYVAVDEMWEAPCLDYPETDSSPGGRLLIVTHSKVLHDSIRPARFLYTSPIREFRFLTVPGRPSGSTPQEMLNPVQKALNRGWAQVLEHRNLMTNPLIEVDTGSGLEDGQLTNRPGQIVYVTKRPGVAAVEYRSPPPLSADVWRTQQALSDTLDYLGNTLGSPGDAPTPSASGELIKELRFNSDRFIGSTARRSVHEVARWADDVIAYLPVVWTAEKILTYAGEDNVVRTVTVLPEMFEGKVNVVPDTESMLPEGRGERQSRIAWMYQQGLFGMPGDPNAISQYMQLARFPNLNRAMRPGGVNRVMAEQNMAKLVQGVPADQIPVFEWYNFDIHLAVTEEYMSSPEFLTLDPIKHEQFVMHREQLKGAAMAKLATQMRQMAAVQNMGAASQGMAQATSAHAGPPPEMTTPVSPDMKRRASEPTRSSTPAAPAGPKQ